MINVPLLSVIVPVYNAEPYLRKCLNSVLAQTFTKFEVICVNDGSTDRSGEICDWFAQKDNRVVVLHKENGGATSARKTGAKMAKGDSIICIDSDDWVEHTYFEQLVAEKERTNADIVVSNMYYTTGMSTIVQRNACQAGIYRSCEIWHEMLYKEPFFEYGILPHLVTKLIDRRLFCKCIQEIDERIVQGEDAALTYMCLLQDITVCVSDICGYHYIQRGNSVQARYLDDEYERCSLLFEFLERISSNCYAGMSTQIEQYKKYLLLLRCPSELESSKANQILEPYGGIPAGSRIILYGAGRMGTTLYSYLTANSKIEIVSWVDRNFEAYRKWGLQVNSPTCIPELFDKYDFIIIAVVQKSTADSIKHDMSLLGVMESKIKWLSEEFINVNDC